MASSIGRRLRHPRVAVQQGLPTCPDDDLIAGPDALEYVTDEERLRIELYLAAVPVHTASTEGRAQQEHLYSCLSIIDAKAQALLSFNSFLLAIVGIYFGNIVDVRGEPLVLIPFLAAVLASGASCVLSLDVIWVHWLGQADMEVPAGEDQEVSRGYIELLILRDERTRNYRRAWLLSFWSVSAVVLGVMASMLLDIGN